MTTFRLLPLVIIATSALFVLRGLAFVSDGNLNAFGTSSSMAQQATPQAEVTAPMPVDDDDKMAAAGVDKDKAMSAEGAQIPKIPDFSEREIQALIQSGISESEIQLLLRLRERRNKLEARERQLELRESMLKAMEGSLQSKISKLEASPSFTGLDENGKPKNPNARVQQMVTVYEAMKPKDAARILSRLDTPVLTSLAKAMKPRKMSAILAQMDSAAAEKLTLALVGASSSSNFDSLPQVGTNGLSQ